MYISLSRCFPSHTVLYAIVSFCPETFDDTHLRQLAADNVMPEAGGPFWIFFIRKICAQFGGIEGPILCVFRGGYGRAAGPCLPL